MPELEESWDLSLNAETEEPSAAAEAEAPEETAEAPEETGVETGPETAAAEVERDPVEELRFNLMNEPGDWYVIHTYSGHERKVRANLEQRISNYHMEDKIFRVEVPMEEVVEFQGTNRKLVQRVRLPGYVLVCMDMDEASWRVVKETPAVTGFVGDQYDPFPLSIDEVVDMLAPGLLTSEQVAAEAKAAEQPLADMKFDVGEIVTVTDGPFEMRSAEIVEIMPLTQKLRVLVTIFERETPVELSFDQVKKLED